MVLEVKIPEREIKRYDKNAVAILNLDEIKDDFPKIYIIDLDPLTKICKPLYVWLKYTPKAPTVMIASERLEEDNIPQPLKQGNCSKDLRYKRLENGRTPKSLELELKKYNSMKNKFSRKDYDFVNIRVLY